MVQVNQGCGPSSRSRRNVDNTTSPDDPDNFQDMENDKDDDTDDDTRSVYSCCFS